MWIKIITYLLKKEKIWSIVNEVETILVAPIKVVVILVPQMGKGNKKNQDDKDMIAQTILVSNVKKFVSITSQVQPQYKNLKKKKKKGQDELERLYQMANKTNKSYSRKKFINLRMKKTKIYYYTHDMKSHIIYIVITFWKYNVNCSILLLFYNKFL